MPSASAVLASSQLSAGTRKTRGARFLGRQDLVGDAADRADLAVAGDGAGARHELRPVEVAGGQFVDDGQAEHQTGRRPAHVGEVEVDGERRPRRVEHIHPEEALIAFGVLAERDVGDARRGVLAPVIDDDGVAGLGALEDLLELLEGGHRLVVDPVDGVPGLQLALRRSLVVDGLHGDGHRVLQVVQCGVLGAVLRLPEVLGVRLVDLFLRLVRRIHQLARAGAGRGPRPRTPAPGPASDRRRCDTVVMLRCPEVG